MTHPFDELSVETLRERPCAKWQYFERDVIPLWVADMDFPPAEAITAAIRVRAESGNLGYPMMQGEPGLPEVIAERARTRYGWGFGADDVWLIHGVIPGLYLSCVALASQGDEVIIQSPIYPPFISAVTDTGRVPVFNPLLWDGATWEMDLDGLEASITPATRLLMLCNPHNPTGRVFRREELERLADIVLKHRLWVVSDELHADLVYDGHQHIPLASLGSEIAARTVTLFGPTKSYNIAGLKMGVVVAQAQLMTRLKGAARGFVSPPNVLAQSAMKAAYTQAGGWLEDTLRYLDGNRQLLGAFVQTHLPNVKHAQPEGTYLAWLDFRELGLGERLYEVLLKGCKVGLNDGPQYGPGGEGLARFNFATSRGIVQEALERLERGLSSLD